MNKVGEKASSPRKPPAKSASGRMLQVVASAFDLVEKRIENGTASSQEVTTLIKYGSEENRLKNEKLVRENELLRAKAEHLKSLANQEELFAQAIDAFKSYSGTSEGDEYD